jgi:hypothetical protein
MPSARHILVVNGRKVRQPVFVIGAPYSGTDLLARALKRSPGVHLTIGQPSVLRVVYAFARRPSIHGGRGEAAASVLRDAFAQGWRITPHGCLECVPACREAAGHGAAGGREGPAWPCMTERDVTMYGDASPDLAYCAEALTGAFPDARIVQIIRDGRDVVASMLSDPALLAWFRPGFANVDSEFPNPFFGVETEADRAAWPELSLPAKCAMRWRGTVRLAARLRRSLSQDQLITIRYETLLEHPAATASAVSEFTGAPVSSADMTRHAPRHAMGAGGWRRTLTAEQAAEVEAVAGDELRRIGYVLSGTP